MSTPAQWTWLVYMAGDNNLEGAGSEDLKEMQQVGSTDQVNVIVQFDTERNKTTRYRVEKDRLTVLQEMPGVDCGDPKVLTDFIRWGIQQYPAEHYLIDVWNHGGGWENLPQGFDYNSIRAAQPKRAAALKRTKRSLFRTTVYKINELPEEQRAIAIDCGSCDYLDNQELHDAILEALPDGKKIDILGCDACLMNMLEIGYEMQDTASYMVGSEETEPGAGWPYADILQTLTKNPQMSPQDLAKTIAQAYGQWYREHGNPMTDKAATQSALDLAQLGTIAEAVNGLADLFIKDLDPLAASVSLARDKAQKFAYPEYIDLGDFAAQLLKRLPRKPQVKAAATKIREALQPKAGTGFVIANTVWGPTVQRASGVSLYFPHQEDYCPDYADLSYSKQGRWRAFLEAFHAMT